MKTYSQIVVTWPFDVLFPGGPFVFGNFWEMVQNVTTRIGIGEVTIRQPMTKDGEPRQLELIVYESRFGKQAMKDFHISATLARVIHKGAIPRAGHIGRWRLDKGENATDGAIRIARTFFTLIKLHTESSDCTINHLLSLFTIHRYTKVFVQGEWWPVEDWVRYKHKLKVSPVTMPMIRRYMIPCEVAERTHGRFLCPSCRIFEGIPAKFTPPNNRDRLVYCDTCHTTWFCDDVAKVSWCRPTSKEVEALSLRFGCLNTLSIKL